MKRYLLAFVISILIIPLKLSGAEVKHERSIVEIKGLPAYRQLMVNGKPFFIKGVGCAVPAEEEQLDTYFKLARQMGANSIRRWGIAGNNKLVLDKAYQYGLMVNQGIWIRSGPAVSTDAAFRNDQIEGILEPVRRYKDHPALLLWNIGNEEIENLHVKEHKIAFCKFLEEVCQEIHKIDPYHPVVYTGIGGKPLKLLRKHTPSLDIYGVNYYAGIRNFRREWKGAATEIPYLFSEYGPDGHWEVKKDEYDKPEEPTDTEKAKAFKKRWRHYIERFKGDCLGGYAFLLEGKNEETETWWGITYQGLRKESFWTLYELYTGKIPKNRTPEIRSFHISPSKKPVRRGKKLRIRVNAGDLDGDPLSYTINAPTVAGASWTQKPEKNKFEYYVPNAPGIFCLYIIVKDDHGNVATASKRFKVK